jgi:AcrR family transcriptional regulator
MTRHLTDSAPATGLRERRRRELEQLIASSAVELFERNGFASTTIDDIAATAGISRTTFFRHCRSKESAVFIDEAGLAVELVDTAGHVSAEHPLRELERGWETMISGVGDDPEGFDRFLRVRRLMKTSPSLLAAGLDHDARLTERVAHALEGGADLGPLDARAVAESFALGMRLAFDEWARRTEERPDTRTTLLDVYREVRAALHRANGQV